MTVESGIYARVTCATGSSATLNARRFSVRLSRV